MNSECVCYITNNKISDMEEWEKGYTEELRQGIVNASGQNYSDPDGAYRKNRDHSFYKKIEIFLNARELKLKDQLKGFYIYKFCEEHPGGIIVKDEHEKELFWLRTDQIGFSAPSKDGNHPYDKYLQISEEKDKYAKVARWIIESRTLGGAFIWPIYICNNNKYSTEYNTQRGGSVNTSRRYYIQDRVDMTLLEVKHTFESDYEKKYSNDVLYRFYQNEKTFMKKWLEHFGKFDTYVNFFMFEKFVDNTYKKPISILNGDLLDDVYEHKAEMTNNVNFEKLFINLNEMIVNRSEKIEKICNSATIDRI